MKKKLSIGFIEPGTWVCGGLRRIFEMSHRIHEMGHDVFVFTPKGLKPKWILCNATFVKLSKLHKYDLDVSVFNLAEQFTYALQSRAKRKVFFVLAAEAEYKHPQVPLQALKQKEFYFAVNSSYTRNYVKKYRKNIKYEIPIFPSGLNPNHFYHVSNMEKIYDVLYYGSPRPWKGTHLIEAAFNSINFPIKTLKMEGLNTPQNMMYSLYNSCTIFVAACQSEGFSMPELEAMKCGCPVLCTDSGGNRDFVVNGENAMVVQRSPRGISEGIKKLLKNKDLRRKLKVNGLKTANSKKFDWDVVTRRFEEFLRSVL